jgi:hypothetical protein
LIILFGPETQYRRKAIYETDTAGSEENLEKLASVEVRAARHVENPTKSAEASSDDIERTTTLTSIEPIPPKKSFVKELALYSGVYTEDNFFKMVVASIAILLNVGCKFMSFPNSGSTIIGHFLQVSGLAHYDYLTGHRLISSPYDWCHHRFLRCGRHHLWCHFRLATLSPRGIHHR